MNKLVVFLMFVLVSTCVSCSISQEVEPVFSVLGEPLHFTDFAIGVGEVKSASCSVDNFSQRDGNSVASLIRICNFNKTETMTISSLEFLGVCGNEMMKSAYFRGENLGHETILPDTCTDGWISFTECQNNSWSLKWGRVTWTLPTECRSYKQQ